MSAKILHPDAYLRRKTVSEEPHIYFTLDFREVVEGHLRRGVRCHLRYDPTRLPVEPGYAFGQPQEPVIAHVQFKDGGEVHEFPLHSKLGIMVERDIDITGHGSTLDASFVIPQDAEKLIVWFSHHRADGSVNYDSRMGENFNFRFLIEEIRLVSAGLKPAAHGATNILSVVVAAEQMVECVCLIYHVAEKGVAGPEKRAALEPQSGKTEAGEQLWKVDVEVSFDEVIIFDLAYEVDARTTVDDNNQRHYLIFPSPR